MSFSPKTLFLCTCLSAGSFFSISLPVAASSPNNALDLKQLGLSQIDVDHKPNNMDPYAIITPSALVVRAPDALIKNVVSTRQNQTGKSVFWFYHAGKEHSTDRPDIVDPLIEMSQKVNALSQKQALAYHQVGQATRKAGQCDREKALARSKVADERMSRMNGEPAASSTAAASSVSAPGSADCGSYEANIKRLERESKQYDHALDVAIMARDRAAKSAEMKLLVAHETAK